MRYTGEVKPRIFFEQKITAFVNQYKVFQGVASGETSGLAAFAQQKRFAFKEKVQFYSDEAKTTELFSFRAEKVLDVHGRYFVEDTDGTCIGMFKKDFKKSLLNSTWIVMDRGGTELFKISESSFVLALARRYAGWIPFVGDIIEIITQFLKYHFVIRAVGSDEEVGRHQKTKLFRDHYTLSLTDEDFAKCDWRVLAAMGVALDALQSR